AQGCAAFSAEAGCLLGKSRRLREPGAQHRARRRGVLSLRQVSLHKQRKVARAVTARKLLILVSAKRQADKTRPTGCGEERVGGVAPTYGDRAARGRRACRGVVPIMAGRAARGEECVGGRSPDLRRIMRWGAKSKSGRRPDHGRSGGAGRRARPGRGPDVRRIGPARYRSCASKLRIRLRWNTDSKPAYGSGLALSTAASTERRPSSSYGQDGSTLALITSPPGSWVM